MQTICTVLEADFDIESHESISQCEPSRFLIEETVEGLPAIPSSANGPALGLDAAALTSNFVASAGDRSGKTFPGEKFGVKGEMPW